MGVAGRVNVIANKPEVLEERDRKIWALRQEKHLQMVAIGKIMKVDVSSVSRSLARTAKMLHAEFVDQALIVKIEQDDQLVLAAQEAFQAWENSKQDATTTSRRTERITKKAGNADDDEPFDPENIPGLYLTADGEEVSQEERAAKIAEAAVLHQMKSGGLVKDISNISTEGRTGDPRHLTNYLKALADRRAMWGADAPKKAEITGAQGGPIVLARFEGDLARAYAVEGEIYNPE